MSDEYLFALICKLKEFSLIKLNTNDRFLSTSRHVAKIILLKITKQKLLTPVSPLWSVK